MAPWAFRRAGSCVPLGATRADAGDAAAKDPIDRVASKLDFAPLVYPGAVAHLKIDAYTPPMWLLAGSDDRPDIITGLTSTCVKLREANVPAELHLYDHVRARLRLARHADRSDRDLDAAVRRLAESFQVHRRGHQVRPLIIAAALAASLGRARIFAAAAGHRAIAGHAHHQCASRRTTRGSSPIPSSATARR